MTFFIIDICVDVKLIGHGLLTFSLAAFIISLYKEQVVFNIYHNLSLTHAMYGKIFRPNVNIFMFKYLSNFNY